MNIPLSCPNCGHENNVYSKNAKLITLVTCSKCNKEFNANFTEKDLKHLKELSNATENIMGNTRITF